MSVATINTVESSTVFVPAINPQVEQRLLITVRHNRLVEVGEQRISVELINYHGADGDTTARRITPLWLFDGAQSVHLKAYDLDKMDIREFRLERIEGIRVTNLPDSGLYVPASMTKDSGGYQCMVVYPVHPECAYRNPITARLARAQFLISTGYWSDRPARDVIVYRHAVATLPTFGAQH